MKDFSLFLIFVLLSISIKLLLIPSKYSTDFEVHRNWLAITANLPINVWYTENGSVWTLDYPPFFAYFEMLLGFLAKSLFPSSAFWHRESYSNSDYDCRIFQKLSVIFSDLFIYGAVLYRWNQVLSKSSKIALLTLILLPSLLIIDHIHFQYNGFMIGLFLICCHAFYQNQLLIGSVLFTILICFKHIFIVFAPILGLYVLGSVFSKAHGAFSEFLLISYSCAKIIVIAFLPFITKGQLKNIIDRLFPIQRGLLHAYWAPNFWALYSCLDLGLRRVFIFKPEIYQKLFSKIEVPSSTLCNGLTGEKSFSILPNVAPLTSVFLIGLLHLPIAYNLLKYRNPTKLIRLTVISGLISFLFGYHVHEKATIPFLGLSLFFFDVFDDKAKKRIINILSASTISLIPLMQSQTETLLAILLSTHQIVVFGQRDAKFSFSNLTMICLIITYFCLKILFDRKEFLPFLIVSSCSSLIICINAVKLYFSECLMINKN